MDSSIYFIYEIIPKDDLQLRHYHYLAVCVFSKPDLLGNTKPYR